MLVVVLDVVDNELFELVLVPDEGAVEEFASDGSDPSFSERVGHRCPARGLENLQAFGAEDLIEGADDGVDANGEECRV